MTLKLRLSLLSTTCGIIAAAAYVLYDFKYYNQIIPKRLFEWAHSESNFEHESEAEAAERRSCYGTFTLLAWIWMDQWRLGNKLSFFAAAYGIQRQSGLELVLPLDHPSLPSSMLEIFPRLVDYLSSKKVSENEVVTIQLTPAWDRDNFKKYIPNCNGSYRFGEPYGGGFKYFQKYRDEIIDKVFAFSPAIKERGPQFLDESIKHYVATLNDFNSTTHLKVCVNARRGDFADPYYIQKGFMATEESFTAAMIHHVQKTHGDQELVFYVISDCPEWFRSVVLPKLQSGVRIVVLNQTNPGTDLYLMTLADVIILTASASTFGMWGAYLNARAKAVYYNREYATKGSELDKTFQAGSDDMSPAGPLKWLPFP